jgi:hypothetical protein
MILNLYIARRFLLLFLQILAGFFALFVMIDMIEELRRFSDPGLGLSEALVLACLKVPATLYRVLPVVVTLSAIALFLGLSRSSELVVVRTAGRSGLSFLMAPVVTALSFTLPPGTAGAPSNTRVDVAGSYTFSTALLLDTVPAALVMSTRYSPASTLCTPLMYTVLVATRAASPPASTATEPGTGTQNAEPGARKNHWNRVSPVAFLMVMRHT